MTDKEFAQNWHLYRKEKIGLVLQYLASALTCRQTPKSRKMIKYALHDAAKLLAHELELKTELDLHALTEEIFNGIVSSPSTAREFLDKVAARVKKGK